MTIQHFSPIAIQRHRSSVGFTLLELMTVVLIVGVLASLAAPGFSSLIANNRIVSTRDAFGNALKMARSEAVFRKESTIVCATKDLISCAGSGIWQEGWLVFADLDNSGDYNANSDRMIDTFSGSTSLILGDGDAVGSVTFTANGTRATADPLRVQFCDSATDSTLKSKSVSVSAVGMVSYSEALNCD